MTDRILAARVAALENMLCVLIETMAENRSLSQEDIVTIKKSSNDRERHNITTGASELRLSRAVDDIIRKSELRLRVIRG